MSITQSTYLDSHALNRPGLVVTTSTCDIDSRVLEGDVNVPFGVAVQQGSEWDKIKAGIATNRFAGITVQDKTLRARLADMFSKGSVVPVLIRGDIMVRCETAVLKGNAVYMNKVTGQFSATAHDEIESVTVTDGGSGYTSAPNVAITGGGGTGATATAQIEGDAVVSVTITNRGSGYTSTPTVAFSGGGGGTGAAATAVVTDTVPLAGARFMQSSFEGDGGQLVARLRYNGPLPTHA